MIYLLLSFFLCPLHAEFTPLPADTPESTNSNFKTIDEEIRRIDSIVSSTASASAIKSATQTFSGANTFTGQVILSSGVAYTQPSSSEAWILNDSLTGGTLPGICSSTVTYTVQGSSVGVYFIGMVENQSVRGKNHIGILVDGAYPIEYPINTAILSGYIIDAAWPTNMSFPPVPIVVGNGTHDFCIYGFQPDATTAYWGHHTTTGFLDKPRWGVKEWR